MQITVNIQEIRYDDLALTVLKALPALPAETAAPDSLPGRLLRVAGKLPEDVVRTLFLAIPREELDGIASQAVWEYQEALLGILSRFLEKYDFRADLSGLSLTPQLLLMVSVSDIDYSLLAQRYLPVILDTAVVEENPFRMLLLPLRLLSGAALKLAVRKLPRQKLDDILMYFIGRYRGKILSTLQEQAQKNGIRITVTDLTVTE